MINISVKGNFVSFLTDVKKIEGRLEDFLLDIGKLVNKSIKERVQKEGKASSLKKMPLYSRRHRARRKKAGLTTNMRNLTMTGKMFSDLTEVKTGKNKVTLFFDDAGSEEKASFNEKQTPFFGISSKEEEIIKSELEQKRFI